MNNESYSAKPDAFGRYIVTETTTFTRVVAILESGAARAVAQAYEPHTDLREDLIPKEPSIESEA